MKLHIMDFLHHHPAMHEDASPVSSSHDLLYTAILVIGVPVTVFATMFAVRYLFDGVMWLLPG